MVSASGMWSRSHWVGSSTMRVLGFVPVIGRRSPRQGTASRPRGPAAHLGGRAAGEPEQLVVGGGEDGVRVAGGRPDLLVPGQLDVDEGADRLGVPDRGDAADRLAGVPADELRGGPGEGRDAEQGGHLRLLDPVGAAGEHEQRVAADVEHQAVGDRAHLDAELGGGRGGGPCAVGEVAHLAGGAGGPEQPFDLGDPGVFRRGSGEVMA